MTLKAKQIEHAEPGLHPDGQGLYLRVKESGAKTWMFRFQINGRRRGMGLGPLADLLPADARAEAGRLGGLVRRGIDPIEVQVERVAPSTGATRSSSNAGVAATFRVLAADYIESHRSGWRNEKHASQWENTLKAYADPVIGDKTPDEIVTDDVLRILKPIWTTKTETASRVRSRIELILTYAKALKLRQGENPAAWRGHMDALLPKPGKVAPVRHHPALPYADIPAFMKALRNVQGSGARALEFAILTAARSGEVRLMTRSEIDVKNKIWSVPAGRMKAKRSHRVALSAAAVAVIERQPAIEGTPYVFPGAREGVPVSDMTLTAVIRRMNEADDPPRWVDPPTGAQAVPHGMRSAFRDWCAEATTFPNEMAEMALAHVVGDKVEAAYRRGDMFERRREMMEEWGRFCDGVCKTKVKAKRRVAAGS